MKHFLTLKFCHPIFTTAIQFFHAAGNLGFYFINVMNIDVDVQDICWKVYIVI